MIFQTLTCSKRRLSIRFQPGVWGTMLSKGQEYPLTNEICIYRVMMTKKGGKMRDTKNLYMLSLEEAARASREEGRHDDKYSPLL